MNKTRTLLFFMLCLSFGFPSLPGQTELIVTADSDGRPVARLPLKGDRGTYQADNGLYIHWSITPVGQLNLIEVNYENRGKERLLLEWALQYPFVSEEFDEYWDGSSAVQEVASLKGEHSQSNIRRMAPWTGVFSRDEGCGVGLGLHPHELKSYIRSKLMHDPDIGDATLEFATRTVVDPGEEGKICFFQAEFPVRFGGIRELIQIVHDAFPEAFHPHKNSAPVYYGSSAQYMMSRVRPENIPAAAPIEHMRRVHGTWDWSYAPFKRTGDHWGEEDLWEYEPNIPFKDVPATIVQSQFHFNEVTRDQFMRMREEHFNRWGKLHGILFYSPGGVWVEKQLAQERFSDALIVDPNFRYDLERWVTTWDREVKVFPWYTSYEPFLRSNFEKIVENYDTSGVALDVARGGPKYRGLIVEKPVEGRAWDEKGLYIDQGIGVARFVDFLHTLPLRYDKRYVLAVVGNPEVGGQTYTVTTRYDAGMYEGPPYHPSRAAIPLARYLLGQKPLSWWAGWMYHRYAVPNWKTHDREHFEKTMQGLVDYVIFSSFEWAGIPPVSYQWGIPKMKRMMPEILQCVRDGWQAVFPVSYDRGGLEHLHTARYGRGEGTTLFWGNPYDEDYPMIATVDNDYLGDRDYVFVDWLGNAPLSQSVGDGETRFEFNLLSREPILQKSLLSFERGLPALDLVATVERSFGSVVVKVEFENPLKADREVQIAALPHYHLSAVETNQGAVSLKENNSGYVATIPVGTGAITLVYDRDYLLSPVEELLKANYFAADGKPMVNIVIDGGDETIRKDAQIRLDQYFAYYSKVAFKGNGPYRYRGPAATEVENIILKIGEDQPDGIKRIGEHTTLLKAKDGDGVTAVLDTFLALLDEKYPYLPGMFGTWGTSHYLLVHTNYLDGYLPDNTVSKHEK